MIFANRMLTLMLAFILSLTCLPLKAEVDLDDKGVFRDGYMAIHVDKEATLTAYWKEKTVLFDSGLFFQYPDWFPHYRCSDLTREIDLEAGTLTVSGRLPDSAATFRQVFTVKGDRVSMTVTVNANGDQLLESARLEIKLPVALFKGRRFEVDGKRRVYPIKLGKSVIVRDFGTISLCTDNPELNYRIAASNNSLYLGDHRRWDSDQFAVTAALDLSGSTSITVEFTPPDDDSLVPPLVHVSQIGYRPGEEKWAVIEIPESQQWPSDQAILQKKKGKAWKDVGTLTVAKSENRWRHMLRRLDFSDVAKRGTYRIVFGDATSVEFPIRNNIYRNLYHDPLDYFIPFLMCHADVDLGGYVRHGLCHADDGRQVEPDKGGLDGFYAFGHTLPGLQPGDHIECAVGGWHDAGDYDLNTTAQAFSVMLLSWAWEDFADRRDATGIDWNSRKVRRGANGVPDVVEQIAWGAEWLLSIQREDGGVFTGVIADSEERYHLDAVPEDTTDGLVYDSALAEDERAGGYSGLKDDREVYTVCISQSLLKYVSATAAAAVALKTEMPALSARCLAASRAAWAYFNSTPTVWRKGPYDIISAQNEELKVCAAADLYRATGDEELIDYILAHKDLIIDPKHGMHTDIGAWGPGFSLPHLLRLLDSAPRLRGITKNAAKYWLHVHKQAEDGSAFGVYTYFINSGWGCTDEFNSVAIIYTMLESRYPDLVPDGRALRYMRWVYGLHPGPDYSFVCGQGTRDPQYQFSIALHVMLGDKPGSIPGAPVPGLILINEVGTLSFIDSREEWKMMEPTISSAVLYYYAARMLAR